MLGAAALFLLGVPLLSMVTPGYTQPLWMENVAQAFGLFCLAGGLGSYWLSR